MFKKDNLTEEAIIFETIFYLLHRYRTSAEEGSLSGEYENINNQDF